MNFVCTCGDYEPRITHGCYSNSTVMVCKNCGRHQPDRYCLSKIPKKLDGDLVFSVSVDDNPDTGKHYRYQYKGIQIDPYRIFRVYGITDPAIQHAIKKLLVAGSRGSKSTAQDIQESIDALARWQSMEQEDSE